jgi:hypothetical protein
LIYKFHSYICDMKLSNSIANKGWWRSNSSV